MALHFCAGTVYISENLEPTASKMSFGRNIKLMVVKIVFSLKHRRGCIFKGATSRFALIDKFVVCNPCKLLLRLSHSCFYMFNYYLFGVFYLIRLLFSAGFPSI